MAKKVRVAFLGCGGIAAKHVRTMKVHPNASIVACCDVTPQIVNGFIDRTMPEYKPRPPAYTDAAEMYKQARPTAVVICTPHTLHYEQAMQALDAGCHVLMEKPMVTSSEHAYKIKAKVDKTGKVFTIAYNTPCSP